MLYVYTNTSSTYNTSRLQEHEQTMTNFCRQFLNSLYVISNYRNIRFPFVFTRVVEMKTSCLFFLKKLNKLFTLQDSHYVMCGERKRLQQIRIRKKTLAQTECSYVEKLSTTLNIIVKEINFRGRSWKSTNISVKLTPMK